jgi:hypothetical protein
MPSDVVTTAELKVKVPASRLPLGFGLCIAVLVSGGLWALLVNAARALF